MPGEKSEGQHLLEEVFKLHELADTLRVRIIDVFNKDKVIAGSEPKPSLQNPLDHLISETVGTQAIIKDCLELLEVEIISKIQGGK